MLSLLKNRKKKSAANEELNKPSNPNTYVKSDQKDNDAVKTKLFLHPTMVVTPEEVYVFQYHHQLLPELKQNQISITGFDMMTYNGAAIVDGFIRQTLPSSIRFEEVTILLLDPDNKVIARKVFDFSYLGELPTNSAIPWKFLFEKEDLLLAAEEIEAIEWKLAFEIKKKNTSYQLELEQSWEEALGNDEKARLQKIVADLPPLAKEEINFYGLKAEKMDNNQISLTLMIRNGSMKNIELSQIPLQLEGEEGEVIAVGAFQLPSGFKVSSFSCKPWTFIFPENSVKQIPVNLDKWKVTIPNNR